MFTAADLIHAVQRKLRLTPHWRSHPPGEFPPGWAAWFAELRVQAGAVTGATAEAMVAVLLARPVSHELPAAVGDLTRWQAFASVWRQHWQPPEADERGVRWFAGASSMVIHVLLGVLFLWLLFAPPRFSLAPPEGEETVVQVEYIGEGTTEDVGGGPQAEPAVEPETSETAPPEPVREVAETPPAPAPVQPAESRPSVPEIERLEPTRPEAVVEMPAALPSVTPLEISTPEPPAPEVEQRLTVSEPAPDTTDAFFLPPPVPAVPEPELAVPELEARRTAVPMREVPTPVQAPSLPSLDIRVETAPAAPEMAVREPELVLREVPAPVRRPELPALATPSVRTPELESSATQVRERSVPAPTRETAATSPSASPAAGETAATPQEPGTQPASPASATQEAEPGTAVTPAGATTTETASRPGSGPRSEPAPGGWSTPSRGDDWGASDREVPGGQRGVEDADEGPGVFNSDGSVRLADTPGSASPAQPPGTHTEEITDLDRTGTWLKRPPIGYEPTMFDRYWRPNETLLQEWVRRGIKSVEIPIPGTTKKISCAVSLLALGGGCGISDPNLNEQPAEARPPPDIPFKPELQEDNGSVRPGEQLETGG